MRLAPFGYRHAMVILPEMDATPFCGIDSQVVWSPPVIASPGEVESGGDHAGSHAGFAVKGWGRFSAIERMVEAAYPWRAGRVKLLLPPCSTFLFHSLLCP